MRVETTTKWRCPYCNREYNTEDRAQECANDCVDIDSPEEVIEEVYCCDYCGAKSEHENEIKNCEIEHEKKCDKHWQKVQENFKWELLSKAGRHPSQKKLFA
jgi:hypothetical protein